MKDKPHPDSIVGSKDDYGLRILDMIRRISIAIESSSKKIVLGSKLTLPQVDCLLAIHECGSSTIIDIASAVHLSSSTVVGIIDRLETKHLVTRKRSKSDRRHVIVDITAEGKAVAKNCPSSIQEQLTRSFAVLTKIQKNDLLMAIELLGEMLEVKAA